MLAREAHAADHQPVDDAEVLAGSRIPGSSSAVVIGSPPTGLSAIARQPIKPTSYPSQLRCAPVRSLDHEPYPPGRLWLRWPSSPRSRSRRAGVELHELVSQSPQRQRVGTEPPAAAQTTSATSSSGQPQIGFEGVPLEQGPAARLRQRPPGPATSTGSTAARPSSSPTTSTPTWRCSSAAVSTRCPPGSESRARQPSRPTAGPGRRRRSLHLLAAHAHHRRRDPHRVPHPADLHARQLLRRVAPAAERHPGGRRPRQDHRLRQRQAVEEEPAGDPAAAARRHPVRHRRAGAAAA